MKKDQKEITACDRYDLAEEQLKAFTRSAVRTKIMLCLKDEVMDSGSLARLIGIRASTVLHTIKGLIDEGLVVKASKGHSLSNLGQIQAYLLDNLVSTIVTLEQQKDFWQTHDISGIPYRLLERLDMLGRSEVTMGDPVALLRTHEYFINKLKTSSMIHGVSPIIAPGYSDSIATAITNGAHVELILTNTILDIVKSEYRDVLSQLLGCESFRLYSIDDPVRVAFTVTDNMLYLGMFRLEGDYDLGTDLTCKGEQAVQWGMELFDHYRRIARRISSI